MNIEVLSNNFLDTSVSIDFLIKLLEEQKTKGHHWVNISIDGQSLEKFQDALNSGLELDFDKVEIITYDKE